MKDIKKGVLAYSGGLDTSIILKWLQETYDCEVVTFTADLGQGEELEPARSKAQSMNVKEIYIEDLRDEFVSEYVFPMFRANAIYEGEYLLGTSIARPLIAKRLVEIAEETGADAISHGATGKGNDQVRFELGAYALNPNSSEMWRWTVNPELAPNEATYLDLEFENGDPIGIDDSKMSPAELLAELNRLGGINGVGRTDIVENRYVGMKSRGAYETPGGTILLKAHRAIESITLDRGVAHLKDELMPKYAELIYNGYWFSPEREMLQTAIDHSQKWVNGKVKVKLYKGSVEIVGRESQDTLFDEAIATFEDDSGAYNQADAEGFIRLNALRLRTESLRDPERGGRQGEA